MRAVYGGVKDVKGNQLLASMSHRESRCLLLLPAASWLCHTLQLPINLSPCFT